MKARISGLAGDHCHVEANILNLNPLDKARMMVLMREALQHYFGGLSLDYQGIVN